MNRTVTQNVIGAALVAAMATLIVVGVYRDGQKCDGADCARLCVIDAVGPGLDSIRMALEKAERDGCVVVVMIPPIEKGATPPKGRPTRSARSANP